MTWKSPSSSWRAAPRGAVRNAQRPTTYDIALSAIALLHARER